MPNFDCFDFEFDFIIACFEFHFNLKKAETKCHCCGLIAKTNLKYFGYCFVIIYFNCFNLLRLIVIIEVNFFISCIDKLNLISLMVDRFFQIYLPNFLQVKIYYYFIKSTMYCLRDY